HLEDLLRREGLQARRRLIVSDSVFSMEGDVAPVAALWELAERYDCLLLVDEAHATGVLGEQGRGVLDAPPDDERIIKIGTLSKALGAQGGFVCGSRALIRWAVNHVRPYIFSTALTPPAAGAARAAVQLVQDEPQRRTHLLTLAERLRQQLRVLGCDMGR